jgi:RES domain-containing protein
MFRGRTEANEPIEERIKEFDFPPTHLVQEGRYNHAGHPVLYLGSDVETCQAELRNDPCLVLEFEMLEELRILDLIDPYTEDKSAFANADLLNCLVYSSLISARQEEAGWHRPHYVVSRFIADCARVSGIDAIRYPSTRRSASNFNLAVVNSELRLASSSKVVAFHRRSAA